MIFGDTKVASCGRPCGRQSMQDGQLEVVGVHGALQLGASQAWRVSDIQVLRFGVKSLRFLFESIGYKLCMMKQSCHEFVHSEAENAV